MIARSRTLCLLALLAAAISTALLAPVFGENARAQTAAPVSSGATPADPLADTERATFPLCGRGPRITCIVDGDTIWYQGTKIRLADIDTPEVTRPACPREAALGKQATLRLQTLLNAGAFTLAPNPEGRDTDRYGRALRVVTRGGASVGDVLVAEGLAEVWGGVPVAWC